MPDDEAYERHLAQIRSACEARDLDALEEALGAVDEAWLPAEPARHVNLLRAACDEAGSCRFSDNARARALIERRAEQVLDEADEPQTHVKVHVLVRHLRLEHDMPAMDPAEWPARRTEAAKLWFGVWKEMEDLIDPDWTPTGPDTAVKPFRPSGDVPFMPGMSPSDVRDPAVRADYEQHLAASAEVSERNKQQRLLRRTRQEYTAEFEDHVVRLYTTPPYDTAELSGHLAKLKDAAMKDRLLQQVRESEERHRARSE